MWTYNSIAARRVARAVGSKTLLSVHGMLAPWALGHHAARKKIALSLYEHALLRKVDCFHASSQAEYAQIRSFGLRQPVALIPLGVAIGEEAPQPDKQRCAGKTLLSLGRLHPVKGLDNLLRAWALVQDRHEDWRLRIAGPSEDAYGAYLEALSSKLGCRRVEFLGPVFGKQKEEVFASSDIFVLPSHSENFGLTVVEALSHGLPVIASRATPWSALESEGCGWWIDMDDRQFAAALERAMSLPRAAIRERGRIGRDWAKREFSWSLAGARMHEAIRWLCGQAKTPDFVIES